MRNIIKESIQEFKELKPYKFEVGGYLIPTVKNKYSNEYDKGTVLLSDEQFQKLQKLNDNCKELYELHEQQLNLIKQYNKGVLYKLIDKIKG